MVKLFLPASKIPLWFKASRKGMEQNFNPVVFEDRICTVYRGSLSFSSRWDQWFPTFCTSLGRRHFVLFKQRQNAQ